MLNFGPTLRTLTSGSPITTALHEARRMARRHLESGGPAVSAQRRTGSAGYPVPADINLTTLVAAIETRLLANGNLGSGRSSGLLNLLERGPDGRMVVPQTVLARLGAGNAARGEQLVERLMNEMRSRRVPGTSQAPQR